MQIWSGYYSEKERLKISVYYRIDTGCLKETLLKDLCDFFILKNATICSGVDQNKKSPSFLSIGQKMPFFNGKLSPAIEKSKF